MPDAIIEIQIGRVGREQKEAESPTADNVADVDCRSLDEFRKISFEMAPD
ncbi:MAG: hypothetical protein WBM40_14685 [Thiohalocapsa sp.]